MIKLLIIELLIIVWVILSSFLSVDIGLPQLAMHSSFETAGTYDIDYAIKAFKEFYQSSIVIDGNKFIIK